MYSADLMAAVLVVPMVGQMVDRTAEHSGAVRVDSTADQLDGRRAAKLASARAEQLDGGSAEPLGRRWAGAMGLLSAAMKADQSAE